jgi:hypothetical protein
MTVHISMTGKKIGKWTVGELVERKGGQIHYSCTCECGFTKKVTSSTLKLGRSLQCDNCRSIPKEVCDNGHIVATYGRNASGQCRLCVRGYNIKAKYGITVEDYEGLYKFQNGKCPICGRKLALIKVPGDANTDGRTEVDHEHFTKKEIKKMKDSYNKKETVRGLLCGGRFSGCNHRLGRIDNVEWLTAALAYVSNPPAKQFFEKKAGHGYL